VEALADAYVFLASFVDDDDAEKLRELEGKITDFPRDAQPADVVHFVKEMDLPPGAAALYDAVWADMQRLRLEIEADIARWQQTSTQNKDASSSGAASGGT
jgi:hypothetical protein